MGSLLLVMAAFWVYFEVVVRTNDANEYGMGFNSLVATSQTAVNDICGDLSVSKLIFRNDTLGQGYLAALTFLTQYPLLGNSRLPAAGRDFDIFQKDTSTTTGFTGNVLLFVRAEQAYQADLAYCNDTSKLRAVRIDLYRIVIYYLTKVTNARIGGMSYSLNLVRAYSEVYADYPEIMAITDPVTGESPPNPDLRTSAINDLYYNHGVTYLWDTTAAVGSAFHALTVVGSELEIAATPSASYHPMLSAPVEFIKNVRYRHASVAWNTGNNFRSSITVPQFGYANPAGDGSPHGFEVQVIGPSGARRALVCLSLARQMSSQQIAAHSAQVIVSSKDY
jgi:hypothetical protein